MIWRRSRPRWRRPRRKSFEKTDAVNCQLTGGGGACQAGAGDVYEIKLKELNEANAAAAEAERLRNDARGRLDTFNTTRESERNAYEQEQRARLARTDDLLIREAAFWQLTLEDTSVKVWRIVFTLLLLGIDLAPLIFKRTSTRPSTAVGNG
jgi:hypothetical protein